DAYLSPILRRYVAQVARELAADSASSLPRRGRVDASDSERPGGVGAHASSSPPGSLRSPPSPLRGEGSARLMFIMSSGGLTAADLFQGKDAILSGPAGGVVGMAETGRAAGFSHLIGFDMGGTSTDVSHFDGEYERAFETEVAGVRMRAPMMRIHT